MNQRIRNLAVSVLMTLVVSCGGGGGGGGGGENNTSTSSSYSSSSESNENYGSIVFNEKNDTFSALPASLVITEGIQQLTQVSASTILKFINDGQPVDSYNSNDTVKISFSDNDLNLQTSAGDTLSIEYLGTYDAGIYNTLKDQLKGKIIVTIESFSSQVNNLEFSGILDYSSSVSIGPNNTTSSDNLVATGRNHFNYRLKKNDGTQEEILTSESVTGQKLIFKNGADTETIGNFKAVKNVTSDGVYQFLTKVSFNMFYEQGSIQDSFTCSTDDYNISNPNYIICKGKNSNAIRWKSSDSPVEIDTKGKGTFKTTSLGIDNPSSYLEGFLFGSYSNQLSSDTSTLPIKNLLIHHDGIAALRTQGALIIASSNKNGESSLYLYDESTQKGRLIRSLRKQASILHMTEDESALYIAYKDDSSIEKYETSNFTLTQQINIGNGLEVLDMDTTMTKPELLAVVTKPLEAIDANNYFSSDVKVFKNGEALPATYGNYPHLYLDRETVDSATFSTQGDKLFCGIRSSNAATTLDITPTGITKVTNNYNSTIGGKVTRHNQTLYSGNSIPEDTYLRTGTLNARPPIVFVDNQKLIVDSHLSVYDLATRANIAQNDIDLPYDAEIVHNLTTLNEHIYLSIDNLIKEIKIDDIKQHLTPTNCIPTSEKNKDAIEIATLPCDFTNITYSKAYPNTIFATLGEHAGTKGNHLILINKESLEIQEYIPLPGTAKSIDFSGNQNIIYITFSQSDYVGRLDLSQESREVTLIPFPTSSIFQSRDDIAISVSQHDDLFIAKSSTDRSESNEKLSVFKNGRQLPYTMNWTQFAPDNPGSYHIDYQFGFSEDGKLYTVLDHIYDTIIRGFLITDSTATQNFSLTVKNGDLSYYPITASNNQLFYLDGTVVDLKTGNIESRIKKPNENIYPYALLPSDDKTRIYQLGTQYSDQGSTLYTFNSTTGDFLTAFNLRQSAPHVSYGKAKLVELPDEILVLEKDGTLFKVSKSRLQ